MADKQSLVAHEAHNIRMIFLACVVLWAALGGGIFLLCKVLP